MCADLYKAGGLTDADEKPDVKAYIAQVLGHASEQAVENYTRVRVENLTRPYITMRPGKEEKKAEEPVAEPRGDNVDTGLPAAPEQKADAPAPPPQIVWQHPADDTRTQHIWNKIHVLEAMMAKKVYITQSAAMRFAKENGFKKVGESYAWGRFLAANQQIIAQYNASLRNI